MPIQIFLRRTALVAVFILSLLDCRAQTAAVSGKLAKMRQIYEAEIIKRKLPVLEKLVANLSALETKLTKANKLEEAMRAREERLATISQIQSLGGKLAEAPNRRPSRPAFRVPREFSVDAERASIQGSLKLEGNTITAWNGVNCIATWSGQEVAPGLYDVYLEYHSRYLSSGGTLKFEELRQDFQAEIPTSFKTTRTIKVGTFKLGTRLGFRIRSMSKNNSGVLDLHKVIFKPVKQP